MRVLLGIIVAFLALSAFALPISAQTATWVRGYPSEGNPVFGLTAGCIYYVAEWSDGSYSSVPWSCDPGVVVREWNRMADRGYPQMAANGCIEYVTQWNDGTYSWVPFECPPGVLYPKPGTVPITPVVPVPPPIPIDPMPPPHPHAVPDYPYYVEQSVNRESARIGEQITLCARLSAPNAPPVFGATARIGYGGNEYHATTQPPEGKACVVVTVNGGNGFTSVIHYNGRDYHPATWSSKGFHVIRCTFEVRNGRLQEVCH